MTDDNRDEKALGGAMASKYNDYLARISVPRITISLESGNPKVSSSRLSGFPYVPIGFEWPRAKVGEYRFLGQFNFSDILNGPEICPKHGMLSLFYNHDDEGQCFWGEDGFIKGYYWENIDHFTIYKSQIMDGFKSLKISLVTEIDYPRHYELRSDWPFDISGLDSLRSLMCGKDDYLLGYPSFNSLAYDPRPGIEWISLLNISSLAALDWCWHDGDKLMVFIERHRLYNRDFSNLKSDAG